MGNLKSDLSAIPSGLLDPLMEQFEEGHATGSFAALPQYAQEHARRLPRVNTTKGRSLCIQVPRRLIGLYELRNNPAIGHISGEIDPNHMDAEFFLRGMKWIMAEFIRFFSSKPVGESRALVEAVTARTLPIVWHSGDTRRILDPS